MCMYVNVFAVKRYYMIRLICDLCVCDVLFYKYENTEKCLVRTHEVYFYITSIQ